jgi:hypothetical protein
MKRFLPLALLLAAPWPAPAADENRDATNARQLFEEGRERLRAGRAGPAKVTFETLIAVYPESSLVVEARQGIRAAAKS